MLSSATRTAPPRHAGHFLGNFKSKFGIKREKAPFVFTTQFLHVMGGVDSERYLYFVEVCGHAYNIVRRNGHVSFGTRDCCGGVAAC